MPPSNVFPLLADFRRALTDCRQLYREAGELLFREYPHLVKASQDSFIQKMKRISKREPSSNFSRLQDAFTRLSNESLSKNTNGNLAERDEMVQSLRKLENAFSNLEDDARLYQVTCPGCQSPSSLPQRYLFCRVSCKKCGEKFATKWASAIL